MSTPPASIKAWARQLLALEAANRSASDAYGQEVLRVVLEKLQISLTRFIGADGFIALLRRALVLARVDVPSLQTVKLTAEGRLEGIEEFAADAGKGVEAATAITTHLLALLVTLIGESLTLRLVRNAWPDPSGQIIAESEDFQ